MTNSACRKLPTVDISDPESILLSRRIYPEFISGRLSKAPHPRLVRMRGRIAYETMRLACWRNGSMAYETMRASVPAAGRDASRTRRFDRNRRDSVHTRRGEAASRAGEGPALV